MILRNYCKIGLVLLSVIGLLCSATEADKQDAGKEPASTLILGKLQSLSSGTESSTKASMDHVLSDIGIYIPRFDGARWIVRLNNGNNRFGTNIDVGSSDFGGNREIPIIGDFNGDRLSDIGVYIPRPDGARWIVRLNNGNNRFDANIDLVFDSFGGNEELPIIGDFNGDGLSDVGVYIPRSDGARWIIRLNNGNYRLATNIDVGSSDFGGNGETPLIGDFNGDALSDIGVYIPRSDGARWIIRLNNGNNRFSANIDVGSSDFGGNGEIPIIGDFNGDKLSDIGIYIPRTDGARWIVRLNNGNNRFSANIDVGASDLGGYGETPIIGNFNSNEP